MDTATSLKELIQKRERLVEVHRENDFTDGIHALLTDLYPDTAHFIYELLQNAEDMNATTVRFTLNENRLHFEHNGTKRTFDLNDIDGITNIGRGVKKNDPTSIGKFGVGFKAVFAYTSTPEIHSGDYHFRIKDYFVPEFEGVEPIETKGADGISWTKFSFPFNNPKKSAQIAYREVCDGLMALDSSSVLFLQHISKIEYLLSNSDRGYVVRLDNEMPFITILCKKHNELQESQSQWLRFHRPIEITDDKGNPKELTYAIAYALEKDIRTEKTKIVPVKDGGKVFIYFPAEKEHSDLRFHISAPFASTVARDSVRNCEENKDLIKKVAELAADSIAEIKQMGLLDHAFFEVLPNNEDNLTFFYQSIFDFVYVAFKNHEYLPAKKGGYVTSSKALMGPAAISKVLNRKELEMLANIGKEWIINASQKNSYADRFIQSLDIETFDYEKFAKIFTADSRNQLETFLHTQTIDWLKKFYMLCAEACDKIKDYHICNSFKNDMTLSCLIRSSKGKMFKPGDIYILPQNATLVNESTPVVHSVFLQTNGKSDQAGDTIKNFFKYKLNIQEYGPRIEILKLLARYDDKITINEEYFNSLLAFAKYCEDNNYLSYLSFSTRKLFGYLDNTTHQIHFAPASDLYLGASYGNDEGEILAEAYGKHCLWDGYLNHYKEKELQRFLNFATTCGIAKGLKIVRQSPKNNPLYLHMLQSDGRNTGQGAHEDYTIQNLERLLKLNSPKISHCIWKCLEENGKVIWTNHAIAKYSPNGTAAIKTCDSTLIFYLKQYAWVPNKQGKLYKPENILPEYLHPDFVYDPNNKLLQALKLGSTATRESQERERLDREAKEAGYIWVPEEHRQNVEKYIQSLAAAKESSGNVAPISIQELLKKQQKITIPNINADDDFSSDGAVNNIARREINIEKTFRNREQMKPSVRRMFERVVDSSKEERTLLQNWYQGKCQMCNTVIIDWQQRPYFIAKNVINTQHLSATIRQTTVLAWNSLCLCPNCAARYDVCSRDLNGLYKQIMQQEIIEGDAERIVLRIELDGQQQEIHYIPKHFLALKKLIQLIDEEISE